MSAPFRSAPPPPKPAPKPGQVKVVRALYTYAAQQPDELSFEEGDVLYILDQASENGWWKASCANKTGLIPSNYVEDSTAEIVHPLHEAAKRGNMAFLKECLSNKVSVNGLDKAGCTALHWASHAGYEECVLELLKVPNIEVNVKNKLGDTPLHSASWKGHSSIVDLLLNKGANPLVINNERKTPYDLAHDSATASVLKPFQKRNPFEFSHNYEDSDESD